jgi:quercetin dioxygenase-like cupin family protein
MYPYVSLRGPTVRLRRGIECKLQSMTSSNPVLMFNFGFVLAFLLGLHPPAVAQSAGKELGAAALHMCVVAAPGEIRPEFGCFRIGIVKDLKLKRAAIFWHLYAFPSRAAADTAKSPSGIVVEEDGRVWLSEFGSRNRHSRGGHPIAVVGPLNLLPAESYTAEIAYSVMQTDDRSRVHTHSGPEAWYVLSGAQCLKTPGGARVARAGATMSVAANLPMELSVTGAEVARSLTLVIHNSTQEFGSASTWKPTDACHP